MTTSRHNPAAAHRHADEPATRVCPACGDAFHAENDGDVTCSWYCADVMDQTEHEEA